jgi:transcription antitermination factor NusG
MSKQHRKTRRREKNKKRHFPSVAPVSRKPPALPVEGPLPKVRVNIDSTLSWCAVQTFPQHEARVSARLKGMGRLVYMPTIETQRIRRNKPYTLTKNMLPRHLFLGLEPGEHPRGVVADVQGVYDFFRHYGNIVLFRAGDIQRFADTLQDEVNLSLKPRGLSVGDPIDIVSGPYAMFSAVVTGAVENGMVRADIMLFGRTSPVDIPVGNVKPVDMLIAAE